MKKKCPECNGTGEQVYSCCTGDIVTNDYMLCPVCREHLGEEDCHLCDGTGEIEVDDEDKEFELRMDIALDVKDGGEDD